MPAARGTLRDSRWLRELLNTQPTDAVFVHTDHEHLVAAMALRKVSRGALVRRMGAGEQIDQSMRTRRAEKLWPARYMYTSETPPTGQAAPSGHLSPMRVELGVPLPSDVAPAPEDGYTLLACIASREALRRATNVVRATAYLAQRHPVLRLRVIGTAAADPDLQVLASALGIGRRVEWVPHAVDPATALRGVSAGWVIADGDDAGLGVLHLMASGIVALTERASVAARYMSHGIHGVLLTNLEPPEMAAETTVLLADADRRRAMGASARTRVEREFPLRQMLSGFEGVARASRDRRTPR
jgi:glycosyltransferase involved in cell wall biosynthesis